MTYAMPSLSQQKEKLKGKPDDIYECFEYLDVIFDDTAKYTFMTFPEEVSAANYHFGLGMWMRNNWGLWRNSLLKQSLIDSGYVHPDDMSSIILKAYHRKLNNKPLNVKEDAELYRKHWESQGNNASSLDDIGIAKSTSPEPIDLTAYFPIGDTTLFSIYATHRKFFQNYASGVRAEGVVLEHQDKQLIVEIIAIEQKKKHFPERVIGDTTDINPSSCYLIPPVGWLEEHKAAL